MDTIEMVEKEQMRVDIPDFKFIFKNYEHPIEFPQL